MKELITIATNEIYSKKEDGTMQKRFEVIVLISEPKWKLTWKKEKIAKNIYNGQV